MSLLRFAMALFATTAAGSAGEEVVWIPAHIVSIDYPLLALQSRTSGLVKVRCVLRDDGVVGSSELLAGSKLLGYAVLARIGEWRFRVGSAFKHRPPESVTLTFRFRLEDRAVTRPQVTFVYDYPYAAEVISQPMMRDH